MTDDQSRGTAGIRADAIAALIALYGPAASTGLGSAVFQQDAVAAESLETAALAQYRQFVGATWEAREAEWRTCASTPWATAGNWPAWRSRPVSPMIVAYSWCCCLTDDARPAPPATRDG